MPRLEHLSPAYTVPARPTTALALASACCCDGLARGEGVSTAAVSIALGKLRERGGEV